MHTLTDCTTEYITMYLKQLKEATSAALPSINNIGTQEMS
jgi:hypothetical protein